jgi:hypothetical protein
VEKSGGYGSRGHNEKGKIDMDGEGVEMGWERLPRMGLCGIYQGGRRPRGKPVTRRTDKVKGISYEYGGRMGSKVARVIQYEQEWEKACWTSLDMGKR